jgi:hypothetical protein
MNTDEKTTPIRKYKRYDEAFKRSAVTNIKGSVPTIDTIPWPLIFFADFKVNGSKQLGHKLKSFHPRFIVNVSLDVRLLQKPMQFFRQRQRIVSGNSHDFHKLHIARRKIRPEWRLVCS